MAPGRPASTTFAQVLRRPVVAAGIAAVLVAVSVPAVLAYRRSSRTRWARDEGIPQIMQLVAKDDYAGAFALATEVERSLSTDPVLAKLWPQFSASGALATDPPGADVYVQPYSQIGDAWRLLGRTPIKNIRLPRGAFRFKIEKDGYQTRQIASTNPGNVLSNIGGRAAVAITIPLSLKQRFPEMVQIPGGSFPVGLSGFNVEVPLALDGFWIDRDEITNRVFKRFVDAGGYSKPEYWNGVSTESFRDSTGRPGPATWELGEYPSGQADYPVGGVSWHEALAYCRSEGKTLPTVYHWARAGLSPVEIGSPLAPSIIPLSNFTGKGSAAVESFHGLGPYGTFDMAGNVREWIWNESTSGRRWILGGSSSDQPYMFVLPNSLPPLDRSAANGLRCARYDDRKPIPEQLLARVEASTRDNRTAKAVSDEVFGVFKRQMSYVRSAFDSRVESRDESSPDWINETLSFDAGYEETRVRAYLSLPRTARPPYQLVVLFPGVGGFIGRAPSEPFFANAPQREIVVKSGRAFVMPVYKGSFERWDPFLTLQGDEYLRTYRAHFFQWRQDLGRILDVLTARSDIDSVRIAYWGASYGASSAFPLLALEDRLKVAVLAPGGFTFREVPPEVDALNYVSHVTMPVLLIGGRHDYIFPIETHQKPMFERLGTPAERKRQVVFDSGHGNFPRSEMIREVLGWLDRYLGPVQSTKP